MHNHNLHEAQLVRSHHPDVTSRSESYQSALYQTVISASTDHYQRIIPSPPPVKPSQDTDSLSCPPSALRIVCSLPSSVLHATPLSMSLASCDWRYLSEGRSSIVFASLRTSAQSDHSEHAHLVLKLHKPSLLSVLRGASASAATQPCEQSAAGSAAAAAATAAGTPPSHCWESSTSALLTSLIAICCCCGCCCVLCATCDGMAGMGWDGMGWDGMGWDGMVLRCCSVLDDISYRRSMLSLLNHPSSDVGVDNTTNTVSHRPPLRASIHQPPHGTD